nr:hypothetical protein Itr_chr14CG07940 [Ipomoea trifida]
MLNIITKISDFISRDKFLSCNKDNSRILFYFLESFATETCTSGIQRRGPKLGTSNLRASQQITQKHLHIQIQELSSWDRKSRKISK